MSYVSEFIQDVATTEILEQFGRDYRISRPQRLFYKDGEMFVREEEHEERYPIQNSLAYKQNSGELLQAIETNDVAQLVFDCYCEEEGNDEHIHHLRSFKLVYHLADDTLSLQEPKVENSGFFQGRIFWHQKVPSVGKVGSPYIHWRDLNVGQDMEIFCKKYRITNCDSFTKAFLSERGIKLNESEEIPEDPWLVRRRSQATRLPTVISHVQTDFIPCPKVMNFRCCWLDTSTDFDSVRLKRIFRLTVYSIDDTISLTEETKEFEGQLFLKRIQLPLPSKDSASRRHYRSQDFRPGIWIDVFCRPMFIFECVGVETRSYMVQQFGEIDFRATSDNILLQGPPPLPVEKHVNTLQFFAKMVDAPSMLYGIDFLLSYNIDTRRVNIVEAGKKYKWSEGRSFLLNVDASTYSEPQFALGRIVQFFKWRFLLVEGNRETEEYLKWRGYP